VVSSTSGRCKNLIKHRKFHDVSGSKTRRERIKEYMMPIVKNRLLRVVTSVALIAFVALGVRLAFAWDQERQIPRNVLEIVPFQNETANIANSLALGKGFGSVFRQETGPTAWLTPVYPVLVGAIFRIFGIFSVASFFAIVLMNSLFSAAACVPIYFAGKRIAGIGVASVAAWLWALFPSAVVIPFEWVWDTSLSALLGATLLWATLELAESQRLSDWCTYGLLWGLALLTNPALASLLPFLLGWATYHAMRAGHLKIARPALALTIAVLCCLPWTIRNYVAFHRIIPLRSNLPFELWLGNNDIFDEQAPNGKQRITRYEEVRRYSKLGETAFMDEKWRLATQFMNEHPALETRLTGRRFVAMWMGTEHPLKDFLETDSLLARVAFAANLVVSMGTLGGMFVLWWRRSAFAFPATVFPVVFPVVYYLTHASLRYRHAIDPVVLLLTAIALHALPQTVAHWRPSRRTLIK
jgi:4-amino-4-deoxy-L-arabinose transferase-like glycosyltransferase